MGSRTWNLPSRVQQHHRRSPSSQECDYMLLFPILEVFSIRGNGTKETVDIQKRISRPSSPVPQQAHPCLPGERGTVDKGGGSRSTKDYLKAIKIKQGWKIPGPEYLKKSMDFFRSGFKRVQFVVLSDDIRWCQDNIRGRGIRRTFVGGEMLFTRRKTPPSSIGQSHRCVITRSSQLERSDSGWLGSPTG